MSSSKALTLSDRIRAPSVYSVRWQRSLMVIRSCMQMLPWCLPPARSGVEVFAEECSSLWWSIKSHHLLLLQFCSADLDAKPLTHSHLCYSCNSSSSGLVFQTVKRNLSKILAFSVTSQSHRRPLLLSGKDERSRYLKWILCRFIVLTRGRMWWSSLIRTGSGIMNEVFELYLKCITYFVGLMIITCIWRPCWFYDSCLMGWKLLEDVVCVAYAFCMCYKCSITCVVVFRRLTSLLLLGCNCFIASENITSCGSVMGRDAEHRVQSAVIWQKLHIR